jgi:hypothetical protein
VGDWNDDSNHSRTGGWKDWRELDGGGCFFIYYSSLTGGVFVKVLLTNSEVDFKRFVNFEYIIYELYSYFSCTQVNMVSQWNSEFSMINLICMKRSKVTLTPGDSGTCYFQVRRLLT